MAEVKYLTKDERAAEKKKLKEEKARFKKEQLAQKKEVKKRAQELADKEDELEGEDGTGGLPVFLVTVLIIVIWLAILCVLVKLDVGGIGSNVLRPLLKDVPVVNQILPEDNNTSTTVTEYGGYTNLIDAVNQIRSLEQQLEEAQKQKLAEDTTVEELKAEITRLKTFEEQQTEFERIRTEFYNEVVYSDEGLGEEAYQKYYESMDPTTAEYLYKQVIQDVAASKDIEDYVAAYSAMKAKDAAEIFDTMTDNLELVAKILANMDSDSRGKILAEMDADVAARVTKILDPD
jgi:flagellar motility protein MotE (MotC chaperone)